MEENINKKNNIQVNALNVGTEKASSKYYSYQNDSTDIIQNYCNFFNIVLLFPSEADKNFIFAYAHWKLNSPDIHK